MFSFKIFSTCSLIVSFFVFFYGIYILTTIIPCITLSLNALVNFLLFLYKNSFRILYVCTIPRTSLFYNFLCFLTNKCTKIYISSIYNYFFNVSSAHYIFHTTSSLGITILHNKYLQQYNCIFSLSQSSKWHRRH